MNPVALVTRKHGSETVMMPGETESVILCEPQCWGFEHASFNAALLQTVLYAFPGARVVFIAEKGHLACVREKLTEATGGIDQTAVWVETIIPERSLGGWKRLKDEVRWFRHVLGITASEGAHALILCSVTVTGLFALKGLLLTRMAPEAPVMVVLHGILSTVETPSAGRLRHRILHLRQALRLPHPERLAYLALGASIYTCLAGAMPQAARYFKVLEPPYLMASAENPIETKRTIRFGYFGVGRNAEKGFDQFVRLAKECRQSFSRMNCEFVIVGFLQTARGVRVDADVVNGLSCAPLAGDEYARRAQEVTYALGLADPEHYRLVASASFLDALCYMKPGIYLRNPYVEHYFNQLGDIGYLCGSYREMLGVVRSIIDDFPEARYRQQCENIRTGRRIFEPQAVAPQLRDIVKESQKALLR